jgi:hypothetical protein
LAVDEPLINQGDSETADVPIENLIFGDHTPRSTRGTPMPNSLRASAPASDEITVASTIPTSIADSATISPKQSNTRIKPTREAGSA